MTTSQNQQDAARRTNETERPPLAVVGSQISQDEELFGRAFDPWVIKRFMVYLAPYKRQLLIGLGCVLA